MRCFATSNAFEEGDGVVHERLEIRDVTSFAVRVAVALLVDAEDGKAGFREADARAAHKHTALHAVAWWTPTPNHQKSGPKSASSSSSASPRKSPKRKANPETMFWIVFESQIHQPGE